jgi:hypothetical protein
LDDGVRYFLEHTAVPFFPPDSFYSEGWRKRYQEFFDSTKGRVLRWLDRIGSDRVDRFGFKLSSVEEQRDYAKRVVEGFKPGFRGRFSGGNIYEVRLQVDSGNLLFLEKSFRKQSPLVQDALMKAVGRPIDPLELGFDVYFSFLGGDREASLLLLSLGVRGLVSEEAGHTVYVIFSDKFVKIVDQPRYHDPRFDEGELFASCSRKFR